MRIRELLHEETARLRPGETRQTQSDSRSMKIEVLTESEEQILQ